MQRLVRNRRHRGRPPELDRPQRHVSCRVRVSSSSRLLTSAGRAAREGQVAAIVTWLWKLEADA
jgi:hypothetical protein